MKKVLGVASTSYHLLVFLFIKDAFFKEDEVDLVVTDKSPYLYDIFTSGRLHKYFHNVFFADGRKIKNPYKSAFATLWESFIDNQTTKDMLTPLTEAQKQSGKRGTYAELSAYDDLFFASPGLPDEIVKELVKTLIKKNHKVKLHRFEDGFASYTKPPVHAISTELGRKLYQGLWRYDSSQMENELYLFEPYLAETNVSDVSQTGFSLVKIPKSPERIQLVIHQIQDILQFQSKPFSEEYMFLGQGTKNCTLNPETYRKLIMEIAEHVGHDRFIVKPHPRGEYDRFEAPMHMLEDSCPFELAIANGDIEDKTLISYYSTACVSGSLLFDSKAKVIFLYPMSEDAFNEKCDYENYFKKLCEINPNIHIARSKDELWKLLS